MRAEREVRRRQTTAERGSAVENRLLEIAHTCAGLSAIEARLDHLLMSRLTGHALVPLTIVKRLLS
ncbi:MAG: hypothetical protein ABW135_04255 [Thermoleophilaceae bacterium]